MAWAPPRATAAAAGPASSAAASGRRRQQRQGRRRRLAAASFDASVAVWEEERPGETENDVDEIENENDDDDEPTLWSQVALLQGHDSEVKGVAWSPLPGAIEAGGSSEDEEGVERGDDANDGETAPSSSPPPPPLLADGEGCLLATCGRDRSVWLWESVPGTTTTRGGGAGGVGGGSACEFECVDVKQGHSGDVKALAWHPSGSVLASASYDGAVRLWLPEGGAAEEGPGGGGGGGGNSGMANAVGDEWLCGQEVKGAHGGETVWSFAFEPRPRPRRRSKGDKNKRSRSVRAVSCGGDGRVSVWRCPLPSGGEPATESLRWEAGAAARSAAPAPLGGKVRPAYSVDWSPCGRWIACGSGDDFVRVFRAPPREEEEEDGGEKKGAAATTTREEEAVLELVAEARPSPPCEVNCVKWRRGLKKTDPPVLAAACDDGTVRLWRLSEVGGGGA